MAKKKVPNWIIISLVIATLIAVKLLFFARKETASIGAKSKAAVPIAANYFVARTYDFTEKIYTTGKIAAINEVELRPEISGKVLALFFKEGQQISKGDPIIKINDADLQAQLQKNRIQVKLAGEKLGRLKKLLSISGVSQEDFDVQENELASLKADETFILAQLAKCNITAPFSGYIGLKQISEGAFVSPNQVLATLVQLKPLYVEFSVPEKYSSAIEKGLQIFFTTEVAPLKTYTAEVYAIEPKIEETTKTLKARALYSGSEIIYPGAFVKVELELSRARNAIMIPTQSVISILKGKKVFVAKGGIAQELKIVTGVRTEDKIQVLQGLQEGDTVLTTGLMSVKKDSKLKLLQSSQ
jgi:membrane fusion protein, multidrug efflux system